MPTRTVSLGLVVLGCGLLLAGVVQWFADRPTQVGSSDAAAPTIQVRARFSGVTPGGQTTGLAVAPDGGLAYVDRGRQRVVRLDANGAPLAEWGPRFEAEADAQDLNGIASSGSDWYLLDRGRARILQLDASGRATRAIDLESLGTYGPNGLAVDSAGVVVDGDVGIGRETLDRDLCLPPAHDRSATGQQDQRGQRRCRGNIADLQSGSAVLNEAL